MENTENSLNLSNLIELNFNQIDNIEIKNENSTGLLYGMPIIVNIVSKNSSQHLISKLCKYSHPNLAIYYGVIYNKSEEKVHLVREFVQGRNFYSSSNLTVNNKFVLLYKIICVLEYLHSFNIFYIYLQPNKIIIEKNSSIKILNLIKDNSKILENIRAKKFNDQMRFFCPDIFNSKIDLIELNSGNIDIYSVGCLIYYSIFQELPWKNYYTKEEILNIHESGETFLEDDSQYVLDEFNMKILRIIRKCLMKDYITITELKEDFENFGDIEKNYLEEEYDGTNYEVMITNKICFRMNACYLQIN